MKKDKKDKKDITKIKEYTKKVSLIDCYITKNINTLIKNKKEKEFIKENNYLLGITNKLSKNSLNILLENFQFDEIKELINHDIRILRFKNRNEKNFLMSMIAYDNLYPYIIDLLNNKTNNIIDNFYQFKIKLLSEKDINNNNFLDLCIELININYETNITQLLPIIKMIKIIYELNKEEIFLTITKLCQKIQNKEILQKILEYINPINLDIYPDIYNNTLIDYLIYEDNIETLNYLIDKIEHIYFVNFEENSILLLLDSLKEEISINIIKIIFKVLSKSNINKLKDMNNENILFKLIKLFEIDKTTIKKFIKYFDIFEQNLKGENIYELIIKNYKNDATFILDNLYIIDSQIPCTSIENIKIIKINYNLDFKQFLKPTNYGVFISDSLHNMLYTYLVLKDNDLSIPYIKQNKTVYVNNLNFLNQSNNDKDILGIINYYFNNFNSWLPHLIIWKDKYNYFIYYDLINWLKQNSNTKRFIYLKLSVIATNKVQGVIRHANFILIDNLKKTVERFEPYGEIYFSNCSELNYILEQEIANKLNYKYLFIQSFPGFQIRSNETEEKNKSHGDPGGFCLAWCFLYLEFKLYYENIIVKQLLKNISAKELINEILRPEQIINLINNYIINNFKNDFPDLLNNNEQNLYMIFIRCYAKKLEQKMNKLIKSYNLNKSILYQMDIDKKTQKIIIENLTKNLEDINKFSNNL